MAEQNEAVAKLVAIYRQLRDQKSGIANKAKEECAVIQANMDKIEAKLLQLFKKLGVDNMKTSAGTPYKSEKVFASVADWDALLEHIKQNDAYELLTRGVSKEAVMAYLEEHNDIPPGVNIRRETVINVRAN